MTISYIVNYVVVKEQNRKLQIYLTNPRIEIKECES